VTTVEALADMTPEQLEAIEGIGPKTVEKISLAVNNYFASLEGTVAAEGEGAEEIVAVEGEAEEPVAEVAAAEAEPAAETETLQALELKSELDSETEERKDEAQ
jgi:N utilization substance protein A